MKKILVLGGTHFIGRNLIEHILAKGKFDITLFNRQQTQGELFPYVKKIKGDRETDDINQIADGNWDYVIDLSCYYPNALKNTLAALNKNVKRYVLVSTCSVYDNNKVQNILRNEDASTLDCTEEQSLDRSTATYGNRKAECERILWESGQEYTIFRPALVYGAYDPTDRFYYWLYQVKHNSTLLLPDNGEREFSITYVKDLVMSIENALSLGDSAIYNAITVPQTSIKQIVKCAQEILNQQNEIVNASPEFLYKNEIKPWVDMPLWIDGDFFTYSNQRQKDSSDFIPYNFLKSVQETIEFYNKRGWKQPAYGMSEELRKRLVNH